MTSSIDYTPVELGVAPLAAYDGHTASTRRGS